MEITQLLERHWKTIAVSAAVTLILAAGLSFLRPLEYSSTMRLHIIHEAGDSVNPFDAIRTAERIAENLGQIVHTSVIFDKVNSSGFDIDANYFKVNENKRREQWNNMVATRVTHETGFLEVVVFHEDKEQASEIARAIGFVLTTEGNKFFGGQQLVIQLVDSPLQSRYPVRPNVPLNAFLGAIVGIILSSLYLVIGEQKKKTKHHHVRLGGTI
jgi:capsular polysaccharide biosynthesis protein